MYLSTGDYEAGGVGFVKLPSGRALKVYSSGYVEGDTHAYLETEGYIFDLETGEELNAEELNRELDVGGEKYYLHEYVYEFAAWD